MMDINGKAVISLCINAVLIQLFLFSHKSIKVNVVQVNSALLSLLCLFTILSISPLWIYIGRIGKIVNKIKNGPLSDRRAEYTCI